MNRAVSRFLAHTASLAVLSGSSCVAIAPTVRADTCGGFTSARTTVSYEEGSRMPTFTWGSPCEEPFDSVVTWSYNSDTVGIRLDQTRNMPVAGNSFTPPFPVNIDASSVNFGAGAKWRRYGSELPYAWEGTAGGVFDIVHWNVDNTQWSNAVAIRTIRPGTISALAVTDIGDQSLSVTWDAPKEPGGPGLNFTVSSVPPSAGCSTVETKCVIGGLRYGRPYVVTVVAQNAAGLSAPISSSSTTLTPPSVSSPTHVRVRPLVNRARVTWSKPKNAASAGVSEYIVRTVPRSTTCTARRTTCTLAGLLPGVRYSILVQAMQGNLRGSTSRPSEPFTLLPVPPLVEEVDVAVEKPKQPLW